MKVNNSNVLKGKINVPTLDEQKKIVEFISLVDDKIRNQQSIVTSLEKQKKEFMRRLFNQELRFRDGNGEEYPEWEEKQLIECTTCLDSRRIPVNFQIRQDMQGIYPYYGANGIQGYVNDYIFDGEFTLLAEDGGGFDDYLDKPIAQFVKGKCWVNNHAHVLVFDGISLFLYYSLVHKDIRKFINGTSRSKLNQADMMMIVIFYPSLLEQQRISDFLSTYDEKIMVERDILARWQTIKKGLLQQMFV